jgi:hypothetical protein
MYESFKSTKDDIYNNELLMPFDNSNKEDMIKLCNLFKIEIIDRPKCTGRNIVDDDSTRKKIIKFVELFRQSNDKSVRLTDNECKRLEKTLKDLNFKSLKKINLYIQLSTKIDLLDKQNLYKVYYDDGSIYYNSLSDVLVNNYNCGKFIGIIVDHLILNETRYEKQKNMFEKFLPDFLNGKDVRQEFEINPEGENISDNKRKSIDIRHLAKSQTDINPLSNLGKFQSLIEKTFWTKFTRKELCFKLTSLYKASKYLIKLF